MKHVEIYTDGACSGNPGPGGYGAILSFNGVEKELSKGYALTTNNRMELLAAIVSLEALKEPCSVRLFSDSRYLVDSVTKGWVYNWREKGWVRSGGAPVPNADLWRRLLPLLGEHRVELVWVRGHADNPKNERCDELARAAIKSGELAEDTEYRG